MMTMFFWKCMPFILHCVCTYGWAQKIKNKDDSEFLALLWKLSHSTNLWDKTKQNVQQQNNSMELDKAP